MDYLKLVLPSLIAFVMDHLAWVLGTGVGLAVLWSPALRRLRRRRAPASLLAAHAEETARLRAELTSAQERIRVLERVLSAAPPAAPALRSREARSADAKAEGRVPTPV